MDNGMTKKREKTKEEEEFLDLDDCRVTKGKKDLSLDNRRRSIKRYTNLRPEEDIAIWYVQVGAELAATMSALLLQFLLVGHRCPSDIVSVLDARHSID